MHPDSSQTLASDLQEFVDTGPNDPAELEAMNKKSRRSGRRSPWFWRLVFAGSVAAALMLGFLLGRLVL